MDTDNIKDRILEFLKAENKSSANFANEIGVQPSAISHIISGRNKPSLDFVVKMINRYPYISTDWLLFGKGSMNISKQPDSLFTSDVSVRDSNNDLFSENSDVQPHQTVASSRSHEHNLPPRETNAGSRKIKKASRIIIFYDDSSFSEHLPDGE